VYYIRFPTSVELDGSDAMNPDPDYSAPYVIVSTDAADGLEGHALTFTIGRGNDVEVALRDFRYISDAITPAEALTLFRATTPGRDNRCATSLVVAFLHTQLARVVGYSDKKLERLAIETVTDGFTLIKLKIGADLTDDVRRFALVRNAVGPLSV
jgi:L-alanine-DL-glutamate epimerase-like enolase superfamily enzyme